MNASPLAPVRSARISAALCVLLALAAAPGTSWAADQSRMVIHAVVLAVDPARSLVVLHHEALETGTATDRVCRLKHHTDALHLARGTVIEAVAETAHQPWVLEGVQVRARMPSPRAAAVEL